MASIGSLVADLRLNSANFVRGFSRAQAITKKETAAMRRQLRSVQTASRGVSQQFGKLRASALSLGGALALGKAAQSFAEFETSLQQIVGLVGVSQKGVNQFKKEILALGPAVGKGPGELADALFFITSAGLSS